MCGSALLYLITGADPRDQDSFLQKLDRCLQRGISLIQFRAKELSETAYLELAEKVISLCHQYHTKILLNGDVSWVEELNADGIHLTSEKLLICTTRPLPKNKIVAASCHNAAELAHAENIHLDFVTLSPVLPTRSHPEATPLGWSQFANLTQHCKLPVFALGGVKPLDVETANRHGAIGIAAISGLWDV